MRWFHHFTKETFVDEDHTGQGPVATGIADRARQAAAQGAGGGTAYDELKEAVGSAGPDERSAAAKELTEDLPAYETLHRALTDLGIEPGE